MRSASSNEYPQFVFYSKRKKTCIPLNTTMYNIKIGVRVSTLHRHVSMMVFFFLIIITTKGEVFSIRNKLKDKAIKRLASKKNTYSLNRRVITALRIRFNTSIFSKNVTIRTFSVIHFLTALRSSINNPIIFNH